MQNKICTECNVEKDLECFSVNKRNKTDGRQSKCKDCNRAYYKANRDRVKKRVRENYEKNNDEILERRKELRMRPEAKVKKAELDAAYYQKNKQSLKKYHQEWAAKNKESLNEYGRRWYHDNLERARMMTRASTQRRRDKAILNGNNTLTANECEKLMREHPYCEYCKVENVPFAIEHIVPLSRGGQNCVYNCTVACYPCNLSKGAKLVSEWKGLSHKE